MEKDLKSLKKLLKTLSLVIDELTDEQVIFLGNNPAFMKRGLTNKEVSLFGNTMPGKIRVAAQVMESVEDVFTDKVFQDSYGYDDERPKILKDRYPATEEMGLVSFSVNADMNLEQAINHLGGPEDVAKFCATPQQIRFLAKKQYRTDKPGTLLYSGHNHFFVLSRSGYPFVIALWWKRDHKHAGANSVAGHWRVFINTNLKGEKLSPGKIIYLTPDNLIF